MALQDPFTAFEPLFAQRALLAVAALAIVATATGPAIVLRDLPFFAHAVGGGAYPALVLAVGIGAPLSVMAPVGALAFALMMWVVVVQGSRTGRNRDAETALLVAASFALGAVLASVFFSGRFQLGVSPEALLFGSVLTASGSTIVVAWLVAAVCAVLAWTFDGRWLATGFDPVSARPLGWRRHEALLLAAIALAVAATLPLAGALMGAALLVMPAATARVLTKRRATLTLLTMLLAAGEGVGGLYLALATDLPPGATIATLSGVVFAAIALLRSVLHRHRVAGIRARPALAGALLLLALPFMSGCGDGASSGGDQSVSVVATTTQVGDVTRNVAGDAADVVVLLQPGADPHDYEPRPSDVKALADADVILFSGGDLDAWLTDAVVASGTKKTPVDVSQSVTLIEGGHSHDEDQRQAGDHDSDKDINPHWYLDPGNLAAAASRVQTELTKVAFDSRDTFRANADRYAATVEQAATKLEQCAATIPREDRAVVTEHDDFTYLTDFLNVQVVAQLRETGAGEATARDADAALDAARAGDAGAVIVSKGEGGELPDTAADRLGVPLLALYGDSLAPAGEAASALGAITDGSRQIVDALGGDARSCPRAGS
jgi:ABC-type Zn uptake system ZnuABC Zn-binding protein ZnuA/ABC-type Mn2+/Zn2+ transport system permease subunit